MLILNHKLYNDPSSFSLYIWPMLSFLAWYVENYSSIWYLRFHPRTIGAFRNVLGPFKRGVMADPFKEMWPIFQFIKWNFFIPLRVFHLVSAALLLLLPMHAAWWGFRAFENVLIITLPPFKEYLFCHSVNLSQLFLF